MGCMPRRDARTGLSSVRKVALSARYKGERQYNINICNIRASKAGSAKHRTGGNEPCQEPALSDCVVFKQVMCDAQVRQ